MTHAALNQAGTPRVLLLAYGKGFIKVSEGYRYLQSCAVWPMCPTDEASEAPPLRVRRLLRIPSVANRFRIALADAFHDEAEMYAASLEHYGFEVHPIQTADVFLASQTILGLYPDAVLTRILPGQFGIDLVRILRTNPVMSTLPIFILTSLAHSKVLDEARTCGATDVLLLPVGAEEIAQMLRRHLPKQKSA